MHNNNIERHEGTMMMNAILNTVTAFYAYYGFTFFGGKAYLCLSERLGVSCSA